MAENNVVDIYHPAPLKSLCFKALIEKETDFKFSKRTIRWCEHFFCFDPKTGKGINEEHFNYMYYFHKNPKFYNFLPILESFRLFLLRNKLLYVIPYYIGFDNISDKSAKIISDSLTKKNISLLDLNLQELVKDNMVYGSGILFTFFNKEKENIVDPSVQVLLSFDSSQYELSLCVEKNKQSNA
jgi:hypothetical protein